MVDPSDILAIDDLKFLTGMEVRPVVTTDSEIRSALERYYPGLGSGQKGGAGGERERGKAGISVVGEAPSDAGEEGDTAFDFEDSLDVISEEEDADIGQLAASSQETPIVRLVNFLISDAVRRGASDIHVEPYEKNLRIRFRIDGVLQEIMSPPLRLKSAISSRVKIMSKLNIAERRIPQDGRINVRVREKKIDLRISIIPTLFGEKIVMRILDQSSLTRDLTQLGFEEEGLEQFLRAIRNPYGIVLVTGPTGSGKTTTLYSALTQLNSPEKHIMTVEDPIEYNMRGINQVQVNEDIGLSFASALRAFLRQAPNIVMVGEIRDSETAEIAIRAALTGHLVLSTIHTNDAPSTISRLMDMGIEPFLVASSVLLIQAQRLVRRICSGCREEIVVPEPTLREMGFLPHEISGGQFFHGKGCATCERSGYKGRIGLYEVMPISPEIREMVLKKMSTVAVRQQAVKEGMLTLRADGIQKLRRGVTTLEEIVRETAAV
jgi:type IV pilus assembly protein PilB